MRVLLDQECDAVAGGHQSACERAVTNAGIIAGAAIGAAGGAMAGGAGILPGAVAGAGIGSLVAQVVAPFVCGAPEEEEEELEPVDPQVQNWSDNQHADWYQHRGSTGPAGNTIYGPHEYVVDGAKY